VLGTLATGFLLIIYLGVNQVFFLVGALLIGLALVYFIGFRRRFVCAALLLVPLAALLLQSARPTSVVLPSGTVATVIDQVESRYGNIKIVDYSYGLRRQREMVLDGAVQSGIDLNSGQSVYAYYDLLGILPTAIAPGGRDCLVIGAGGGSVPLWYEEQGVRTDVVDIDPEIIRMARQYFGFAVSGAVTIEDA
ncbi:MAG: fused MFS/spermidine synthase, partial [Elusimicrobiales bacterium]|nr:fused MFS/spermidine synthase [Elusimicrobiales bacterium]